MSTIDLKEKANYIRSDVMRVASANGAGHIAPSLSCIDVLVSLYYKVMHYPLSNPEDDNRDRLIFSKSHGCYGQYAILADLGIIPKEDWEHYYTDASSLKGCAERNVSIGIEAGCGALGHGLPMAVGLAYGAKLQKKEYHVFCIVGDGECQEGSIWEALLFAVKYALNNLTIIVDHNRLQAMDFIANILDRDDSELTKRIQGFGPDVQQIDGHDIETVTDVFLKCRNNTGILPSVVVANTIKGYGFPAMENTPKFHFRIPTDDEKKPRTENG